MNVLDKGLVPKVMSLKEVLAAFVAHRREVLERRSAFRLEKIAARLEVLEGYLAVFLNLDKVIKIIRTEDEPKPKLMKAFALNEVQAEAILNMRLRSLRKLEEMEIRGEHDSLTKERKELTKLLGSEKLEIGKADRGTEGDRRQVRPQDHNRQAPHRNRQGGRSGGNDGAGRACRGARQPGRARTDHRRLFGEGLAARAQGPSGTAKDDKYREGDRARFWFYAQTTDKIMLFATDGRFFTLDCAKLPGGRGNGEAIRTFIDLPPEADIVTMFVHVPGRKLLVAATSGHGFITNEDEAVAMTKNGKRVMNVKPGVEAASVPAGRRRSCRGHRREPQAADLQGRRSAGDGARAGRLPAALQGRQPDRRHDLHLEKRPQG